MGPWKMPLASIGETQALEGIAETRCSNGRPERHSYNLRHQPRPQRIVGHMGPVASLPARPLQTSARTLSASQYQVTAAPVPAECLCLAMT